MTGGSDNFHHHHYRKKYPCTEDTAVLDLLWLHFRFKKIVFFVFCCYSAINAFDFYTWCEQLLVLTKYTIFPFVKLFVSTITTVTCESRDN